LLTLLTFCSLSARVLLTFCSFYVQFCSYLLIFGSFLAHFLLTFYSLSATRLTGHKAAQGHGEDAATACRAGHTGVRTAGARGCYSSYWCGSGSSFGSGSGSGSYVNGHRKKRSAVVCGWFDGEFGEGHSEREALKKGAKKVREQALQNCLRAAKRPTRAAGGTGWKHAVSGNKNSRSWCFLGGFFPFPKEGSSTFSIFKKSTTMAKRWQKRPWHFME